MSKKVKVVLLLYGAVIAVAVLTGNYGIIGALAGVSLLFSAILRAPKDMKESRNAKLESQREIEAEREEWNRLHPEAPSPVRGDGK